MKGNRRTTSQFTHSSYRRAVPGAFIFTLLLALPIVAFSEIPRGVYSIAGVNANPATQTLENPDVDGISLRTDWSTL